MLAKDSLQLSVDQWVQTKGRGSDPLVRAQVLQTFPVGAGEARAAAQPVEILSQNPVGQTPAEAIHGLQEQLRMDGALPPRPASDWPSSTAQGGIPKEAGGLHLDLDVDGFHQD